MEALLFQSINGLALKYFWLDVAAIFLAKYLPYILGACLCLFLLVNFKRYWKMVLVSCIAALFSRFVLVELVRLFISRPRPLVFSNVGVLLTHSLSDAFPSGHTSFFFAISAVIWFYNKRAGIVFLFASFLMALSRIFCGLHWPSDIAGGIVLGILAGCGVFKVFEKSPKQKPSN